MSSVVVKEFKKYRLAENFLTTTKVHEPQLSKLAENKLDGIFGHANNTNQARALYNSRKKEVVGCTPFRPGVPSAPDHFLFANNKSLDALSTTLINSIGCSVYLGFKLHLACMEENRWK